MERNPSHSLLRDLSQNFRRANNSVLRSLRSPSPLPNVPSPAKRPLLPNSNSASDALSPAVAEDTGLPGFETSIVADFLPADSIAGLSFPLPNSDPRLDAEQSSADPNQLSGILDGHPSSGISSFPAEKSSSPVSLSTAASVASPAPSSGAFVIEKNSEIAQRARELLRELHSQNQSRKSPLVTHSQPEISRSGRSQTTNLGNESGHDNKNIIPNVFLSQSAGAKNSAIREINLSDLYLVPAAPSDLRPSSRNSGNPKPPPEEIKMLDNSFVSISNPGSGRGVNRPSLIVDSSRIRSQSSLEPIAEAPTFNDSLNIRLQNLEIENRNIRKELEKERQDAIAFRNARVSIDEERKAKAALLQAREEEIASLRKRVSMLEEALEKSNQLRQTERRQAQVQTTAPNVKIHIPNADTQEEKIPVSATARDKINREIERRLAELVLRRKFARAVESGSGNISDDDIKLDVSAPPAPATSTATAVVPNDVNSATNARKSSVSNPASASAQPPERRTSGTLAARLAQVAASPQLPGGPTEAPPQRKRSSIASAFLELRRNSKTSAQPSQPDVKDKVAERKKSLMARPPAFILGRSTGKSHSVTANLQRMISLIQTKPPSVQVTPVISEEQKADETRKLLMEEYLLMRTEYDSALRIYDTACLEDKFSMHPLLSELAKLIGLKADAIAALGGAPSSNAGIPGYQAPVQRHRPSLWGNRQSLLARVLDGARQSIKDSEKELDYVAGRRRNSSLKSTNNDDAGVNSVRRSRGSIAPSTTQYKPKNFAQVLLEASRRQSLILSRENRISSAVNA